MIPEIEWDLISERLKKEIISARLFLGSCFQVFAAYLSFAINLVRTL
jgi:hypothetical protein